MTIKTKPLRPVAPAIIIPIATRTNYPGTRPAAVSLIVRPGSVLVREEMLSGYLPLLDCAEFATPAAAAEALAERYAGAPDHLFWDDFGTAYAQALTDGAQADPIHWIIDHTRGHLILDLPGLAILTWAGGGAYPMASEVSEWLALALPDRPVRVRDGGNEIWEVVAGVLHG